jgi:hypothetical protein
VKISSLHVFSWLNGERYFRLWKLTWVFLALFLLTLIGLRLYFPIWVLHYVNEKINETRNYSGSVENVDMHLWRGAYVIRNVTIYKDSGKVPVPFFSSPAIDLSLDWKALFDGAFVGNVECKQPRMNFVKGPTEAQSQIGADTPWIEIIRELFPLKINRFHVENGEVHYRDFFSSPQVDLVLAELYMTATNLTNSRKLSKSAVATIHAEAKPVKEGTLRIDVTLDPYPTEPTFDLKAEMTDIPLVDLNQFASAYGDFDFQSGTFSAAMQIHASNGRFNGYIKPVFDHMEILSLSKDVNNPIKLVWEGILESISHILRNLPKDRFATLIPLSGSIHNPRAAVLAALGNVFKNAFIKPYNATVPGNLDTHDVHEKEAPKD